MNRKLLAILVVLTFSAVMAQGAFYDMEGGTGNGNTQLLNAPTLIVLNYPEAGGGPALIQDNPGWYGWDDGAGGFEGHANALGW